ncbi:MAG: GntR family transcriptional regulator [Anaerolineales bacterium]|nr:GntR family transcriptional regulator [Anaerolineales bacterium]
MDIKKISKNSPIPLYLQLRYLLLAQLERGDFDESGFPAEREIEQKYNVSRTTVRRATDELAKEGYITRQRGRGSFAIPSKTRILGSSFHSVYDDLNKAGHKLEAQVINYEIKTLSDDILKIFGLDEPREFIVVDLLRILDREPFIIASIYIPNNPDYEIEAADFENYGSTIYIFEEKLGTKIVGASRSLEAVRCLAQEAALLNVQTNDPLLMTKTLVFDDQGKPVFYAKSRYRSGRYQYYIPFLSREPTQGPFIE